MTLLMLTPVLTCVMVFCPLEAAQAAEPKPCHQNEDSRKHGQKEGPMLALDCLGVDLFQPGVQSDIVQPDQSQNDISFAWADLTSGPGVLTESRHLIRGPPFDSSPPHLSNHDLYLTTQRLRI